MAEHAAGAGSRSRGYPAISPACAGTRERRCARTFGRPVQPEDTAAGGTRRLRAASGTQTRRGVAANEKRARARARAEPRIGRRRRMAAAARTSVVLASGAPQAEKMVSEPGADTPDARSAVSRARPVAGVSAIGPALGACERRARARR